MTPVGHGPGVDEALVRGAGAGLEVGGFQDEGQIEHGLEAARQGAA